MSFKRMMEARRRGFLYCQKDYVRDEKTGSGGKVYHRFLLNDEKHFCAGVRFPSESKAVVQVLSNGNVVPYISFEPAETNEPKEDIIEREINYDPHT